MCKNCYRRSLACYTPATDEMLPQDREDLKTFWREYEDWMDDYADLEYERRREERYDD